MIEGVMGLLGYRQSLSQVSMERPPEAPVV